MCGEDLGLLLLSGFPFGLLAETGLLLMCMGGSTGVLWVPVSRLEVENVRVMP